MDAMIDTRTLRLVRVFDAPRERVFAAWTDAKQFIEWMCPPGVKITLCEIDVRAGGAWRIAGVNEGERRFASSGKYLEVKRPERLIFTWAHHADGDFAGARGHETTVRVEFRAVGDKTELTLLHGPFVDGFREHKRGWEGSFDKLATYLNRGV